MDTETLPQPGQEAVLKLMNRPMQADPDGLPRIGALLNHLGAIIQSSVSDNERYDLLEIDGRVSPGHGGMSVYMGEVSVVGKKIPKSLLPAELGGYGENPLYQMYTADLPDSLRLIPDRPPAKFRKKLHAMVEPTVCCASDDYQAALCSTRPHWKPYTKEPEL